MSCPMDLNYKPKTILFLIPSLAARGAERVLVNLVNSLDKTRYQVTLQTLFDAGELRAALSPEVEYRSGFPFVFRGNVQLMKLFSPSFLYRMVVGKRYDIVVAYLEGAVTRIISGCPYPDSRKVAWVHIEQHELSTLSHCYRSTEEALRCYRQFDRVVAVSQTVRRDFQQLVPVPCDVLYNINDDQRIRQLSSEPVQDIEFSSDPNLICVARLDPLKGLDRLVRVHRRLLDSGIRQHVYVLGDGPMKSQLQQLIRELHVESTFHLLGHRSNPYKYVAQSDLYVCSSSREGLSTSVSEALILGKPVVSTCCSGAEELLGPNNEYGLVVPNSEDGLFEGIQRMLTHSGLLSHYKSIIRESVLFFSKDQALRDYHKFFNSL